MLGRPDAPPAALRGMERAGLDPSAPLRGTERARPDPTPMRLALGAGSIAALSALVATIVTPPSAPAPVPAQPASRPATVTQQQAVQYIQLAPGQSAPPGARIIDAKAPKPITIVTTVPAPAQQTVVVRTTQSGKPVP